MTEYLYIIKVGDLTKVGRSANPDARAYNVGVEHACECEKVALWKGETEQVRALEKIIINLNDPIYKEEYFDIDPFELRDLVSRTIAIHGYSIAMSDWDDHADDTLQVSVRMEDWLVRSVDNWRRQFKNPPSRPESIRRLIQVAFVHLDESDSITIKGDEQ